MPAMPRQPLDYERRVDKPKGRPTVGFSVIVTLAGIVPLTLGLTWLRIAVLPDDRDHLRGYRIAGSILVTAIGVGLMLAPWHIRAKKGLDR